MSLWANISTCSSERDNLRLGAAAAEGGTQWNTR